MGSVIRDRRSGGVVWAIRYQDVDGRVRKERTKAPTMAVARNPLQLVDKPTSDNTVVRWLDHDEEAKLLAAAPEHLAKGSSSPSTASCDGPTCGSTRTCSLCDIRRTRASVPSR
jgi:hypothetical protein